MTISAAAVVIGEDIGASAAAISSVTKTVAAGSYLHCAWTWDTGGDPNISSVDSSPALTWTKLDTIFDTVHTQKLEHWVSSVTSAGSITVSAHWASTVTFRGSALTEIIGSSGYDSAAAAHNGQWQALPTTGTDSTSSLATPTLTSQPALISGFCSKSSGAVSNPAAGTGFTDGGAMWQAAANGGRAESKRVTATTGVAATYTAGLNNDHLTAVAVFLEAAGGSTSPIPLTPLSSGLRW